VSAARAIDPLVFENSFGTFRMTYEGH
jgi:hypothetical protein